MPRSTLSVSAASFLYCFQRSRESVPSLSASPTAHPGSPECVQSRKRHPYAMTASTSGNAAATPEVSVTPNDRIPGVSMTRAPFGRSIIRR